MSRQSYNTRYKSELSPRQRDVLDLIARGKTNTEIGAALGISLDGAKYHVSEVLAKLGLTSREEAAEWWREQNRPLVRLRARIAGIPLRPFFLATGFGGGLACAAAAVVLFFPGFTGDGKTTLPPCRPADVQLRAGTSLGDKSSNASLSVNAWTTSNQACAIDDAVTLTVLDRTGVPLALVGNGTEVQLHAEFQQIAFVRDLVTHDLILVTPGPSAPPNTEYTVSATKASPSLLWTNWCDSYSGAVTVILHGRRYAADGPSYISNPPRCLDPSEPSKLQVVTPGR